jgi:uncharacterized membrane protein
MKKLLIALCAVLLAALFVAPKVSADVQDFVINDLHGQYQLFNDVHGGRMETTETIKLTFSGQNHGIERAIPTNYKDNSFKLKVVSVKRDGQDEQYTTYEQNQNQVLRIGHPDKTITGAHTYQITYEMRNVISFYKDYDEWYWNINGYQWLQQFEHVSGEVIMPEGWNIEGLPSPSCYTGRYGSTSSVCSMNRTTTGYSFEASVPLGSHETLTVVTPFQKGLFTPRDRSDWLRENAFQLVGLAAGGVITLIAFDQWRRWGKDHKGRGVIIPEYKPPKDMSAAEVGLLYDYNVDSRDLTATIIDLAIRGYVKVHQNESKKLGLFKSQDFQLELVKTDFSGLKAHEKELLKAMFNPQTAGKKIDLKNVDKSAMYKAVTAIRKHLHDDLTKKFGLIEQVPAKVQAVLWGVGIGALIGVFFFSPGWGWMIGLLAGAAAAVVFGLLMRRRSHAGVKMYEDIQGLKLYMETAESERIKMLQSVSRPYAEKAKTVEFFEKLLPYAVALGVEESWAKQFDNIYREPPTWYSGNMAAFNTVYFTNSLASSVGALNNSFSASAPSSGSGSGGGGFSGGGGGGGGGGGW